MAEAEAITATTEANIDIEIKEAREAVNIPALMETGASGRHSCA